MTRIRKITICGFGLIGGCIALDLLRNKSKIEIVAYDRQRVLEKVKKTRSLKVKVEKELHKAIADSDMIILSAPHKANESLLSRMAKISTLTNCLILDTGGVKGPITELAKSFSLAEGTQFLPTHPMAGREKAGFENSAERLFKDRAWYVSEDIELQEQNLEKIDWLIKKTGAMKVEISSALHDELVSEISHLPQLISTILGGQVSPDLIELAGPGLRSMLRLAGSPYAVWQEIITENKAEIIKSLRLYRENLDTVIKRIEADESLKEIFQDASRSYKCL